MQLGFGSQRGSSLSLSDSVIDMGDVLQAFGTMFAFSREHGQVLDVKGGLSASLSDSVIDIGDMVRVGA